MGNVFWEKRVQVGTNLDANVEIIFASVLTSVITPAS